MPSLLQPAHADALAKSAISPEIITQRGYTTLTEYRELKDRGFSDAQSHQFPCLGIPLWDVSGQQNAWQIRPDQPRIDRNGRPGKYQTPRKARLTLDVHPQMQPLLANPAIPLWITEGVKKGDALATQGCCAIALMGGVWGWRGTNAMGGKTALPDWDSVALNGRDCYIIYDNDVMRNPKVRSALEALCNFLTHKQAKPHLLLLPDSSEKIGVDDYLAQGHTIADVLACEATRMPDVPHAATLKDGRPLITQHPHELPAVVAHALAALHSMPQAPRVYQRTRRLCSIAPAEPQAAGLARPTGAPIIRALTAPCLRLLLSQSANWQTPNKTGTKAYPDKPAAWLVETLLDMEEWPQIPPLTGLLGAPTLRRDGTLLTTPGYDAHTGLHLTFRTAFPAIPDQPDPFDASAALATLQEPFADFPFESECHRSATLAAILSLLARYAVESVPLFAIRATTRGSGKTLLADAISLIATGRVAAKLPQAREEEEEKKRLLAIALDGDPLVLIDNVSGDLGSPALDLAITSQRFKDRLLGKNATEEAAMYTVFLATGNHLTFRGDMARRVIPIDLLPDTENPEERTGFRHPRLLDYIEAQRPALVVAALTLLRAYCVAGRPAQALPTYGSFEAWSDLIRSALVWAGAADPCLGRIGLEAQSDEAYDALGELLDAWHGCYGTTPTTLKTVFRHLELYQEEDTYQRLQAAIEGFAETRRRQTGDKSSSSKLSGIAVGNALKKAEKRIINHKRFEKQPDRGVDGFKWAIRETL